MGGTKGVSCKTSKYSEPIRGDIYGDWLVLEASVGMGDKKTVKCICKCDIINKVPFFNLVRGLSNRCKTCSMVLSHKTRVYTARKRYKGRFI